MAKINVQRYKIVPVDYRTYDDEEDDRGNWVEYADVAPLLAELAELRERTRMRLPDDASHGVAWVLGRARTGRSVVVRFAGDYAFDEFGGMRDITGWWPLPEVAK